MCWLVTGKCFRKIDHIILNATINLLEALAENHETNNSFFQQ